MSKYKVGDQILFTQDRWISYPDPPVFQGVVSNVESGHKGIEVMLRKFNGDSLSNEVIVVTYPDGSLGELIRNKLVYIDEKIATITKMSDYGFKVGDHISFIPDEWMGFSDPSTLQGEVTDISDTSIEVNLKSVEYSVLTDETTEFQKGNGEPIWLEKDYNWFVKPTNPSIVKILDVAVPEDDKPLDMKSNRVEQFIERNEITINNFLTESSEEMGEAFKRVLRVLSEKEDNRLGAKPKKKKAVVNKPKPQPKPTKKVETEELDDILSLDINELDI